MNPLDPWILPSAVALGVALAALVVALRTLERRRSSLGLAERDDARARGSHAARLQHPHVDLEHCIGCGACVRACPEEGVLAIVHGQAAVVHGARCVGHGLCAEACPTGAIAVTLGDLSDRDDLPVLSDELEALRVEGLFIAGELGGRALVRTAIAQGSAVADAVARRCGAARPRHELDLLVVGAGPGGLACALRARELGLRCAVLEQEPRIGGAVAGYPRAKLVMTQPVVLPLHGRLPRLSYAKEELIEIWEQVVSRHELDLRTGVRLTGLRKDGQGFVAATTAGELHAPHVCLALGRRGTPRRLGVPGEDLPKVHYALIDAQAFTRARILVVGGGDSAIEAALGLAAQPGNEVTISYRKHAFFRLKARNEAAIRAAELHGRIDLRYETEVVRIDPDTVELGDAQGGRTTLPNDAVFVLAGGIPPFGLLREAGVSFDPADRPPVADAPAERSSGLGLALGAAALAALGVLAFTLLHADYYRLPAAERLASPDHATLRPGSPFGIATGLLALVLFACNLAYLLRRSLRLGRHLPGSLRGWMGAHVFTGITALSCVLLHSALAPRQSVGGHALAVLVVVVATGAVGRYLYAFVPRAANGAELELDELRARLAALSGQWGRDGFGARVRSAVETIAGQDRGEWRRGLAARIVRVLRSRVRLERSLLELRHEAARAGVARAEFRQFVELARRAHRLLLAAAHLAELRALLGSWRYLHRWLALLLLVLTALHVTAALRFASIDWPFAAAGGGAVR